MAEPPRKVQKKGFSALKWPFESLAGDGFLLGRGDSWTNFERNDPIYALKGELEQNPLIKDGELCQASMDRVLEIMVVQGEDLLVFRKQAHRKMGPKQLFEGVNH